MIADQQRIIITNLARIDYGPGSMTFCAQNSYNEYVPIFTVVGAADR